MTTASQAARAQRKQTRIDALAQSKAPRVRPSVAFQRNIRILDRLASDVNKKGLKELPANIREMIYRGLWIADGCPYLEDKTVRARALIDRDISVLSKDLPPIFSPEGGSVLAQISSKLQDEMELEEFKELLAQLAQFAQSIEKTEITEDALKGLFDAFPDNLKASFIEDGLDVANLRTSIDLINGAIGALSSYSPLAKIEAKQQAIFNHCYENNLFTHRQLRNLYKEMMPSVQAVLPKGPYDTQGVNAELYKTYGAHFNPKTQETQFKVYAPNAKNLTLVLLNKEAEIAHEIPMVKEGGDWVCSTPLAKIGSYYYFNVAQVNTRNRMVKGTGAHFNGETTTFKLNFPKRSGVREQQVTLVLLNDDSIKEKIEMPREGNQFVAKTKHAPLGQRFRYDFVRKWGGGWEVPFSRSGVVKSHGAHCDFEAKQTTFRLSAPNARSVSVVLTHRGKAVNTIELEQNSGLWEGTSPLVLGQEYYFIDENNCRIGTEKTVKKIDPFAFRNAVLDTTKKHENVVSVVESLEDFVWEDAAWIANRKNFDPTRQPMSIYEVFTSWWKRKENGEALHWRDFAIELGNYCQEMGYTHVHLFGLSTYTQEDSMGFRVVGYFSPDGRLEGTLSDVKFFVNHMHKLGIGVFGDFVGAHFGKHPFSLRRFDGTALFEDEDRRWAKHPDWHTMTFDYDKSFTRDFLCSSMQFLFEQCHFDGVRLDALESIYDQNFDRKQDGYKVYSNYDFRQTHTGDSEHRNGLNLIRTLTALADEHFPGTLIISEDSGNHPALFCPRDKKLADTRPHEVNSKTGKPPKRSTQMDIRGLGVGVNWTLGSMTDFLHFMKTDLQKRPKHYHRLVGCFSSADGIGDFQNGRGILADSHDESAQGKGSRVKKMPGKKDEQFASARLVDAFITLRGKANPLVMMGNDLAQPSEWHWCVINKKSGVEWQYQDDPMHKGSLECRKALNFFYRASPGLWNQTPEGVSLIHASDAINCVVATHRRGGGQQFLCAFNFSRNSLKDYMIPLPQEEANLIHLKEVREVFSTDAKEFGGRGHVNTAITLLRNADGFPTHIKLNIPPLTALVLEESF